MSKTYTFIQPVEYKGSTFESIELDFDALTGQDLIEVERLFIAADPMNEAVNIREFSKEYQIIVASQLASLPIDFFHKICARDFSQITTKVRLFFSGVDL